MVCEYEFSEGIIKVNCLGCVFGSNIEDFEACMAKTIDKLLERKDVERIILAQTTETEYDFNQVKILREIAEAYNKILNEERLISPENLTLPGCEKFLSQRLAELEFLILQVLRKDPIGAFVRLNLIINHTKKLIEEAPEEEKKCHQHYLTNALEPIKKILESTQLIQLAKPKLLKFRFGDRSLYREIFSPEIRPRFILTRFTLSVPKGSQLLEKYYVAGTLVEIFKVPGKVRFLYRITPEEFMLSEEKCMLLDFARRYLAEHKPTEAEIAEPEKSREIFLGMGKDLIKDIARSRNVVLTEKEVEELARILTRYTAGFGVLELLLADEKIQDISINSPIGLTPIYIYHSDFEECETNLIPTKDDAEAWATRFRLYSGRPLDEANPVLDAELSVPGGRARVCAITRTLSPEGLAYAFRRHRERPWTFPLFMKAKFFDPLYAGLMSFIVDGGRALLIAGGRSSGKTSLLSAMLLEIMRKFRIVVVEDTLELPVVQLRKLGYNIERMKSRSVITRVETELPPDEALRTALRLGDSSLIIGEVRSSLRGDQEVLIVENGLAKRVKIANLEHADKENILVPTLDIKDSFKVKLERLKDFVKHPKRKKFVKITTRTGREVVVTPEHSVFTLSSLAIKPIEAERLEKGSKLIIPARIPSGYNDIEYINLFDILPELRLENAEGYIREAIKKLGWRKSSKVLGISDIYMFFRKKKCRIKAKDFVKLMKEANIEFDIKKLKVKNVTSKTLPVLFRIDEDFCKFMGYIISEGYIDAKRNSITITNSDEKVIEEIKRLFLKITGERPKERKVRGWGTSTQLYVQNSPLTKLLLGLGCGAKSKDKRVPNIIFGLSQEKINAFLKGLYTGDGSFTFSKSSGNAIRFYTVSKRLAEDVMYLLLSLGIVARFFSGKTSFVVEFKQRKYIEKFLSSVGFDKNIQKMVKNAWSHSKVNELVFSKEELKKHVKKLPRKFRHLNRFERCSKFYFEKIVDEIECSTYLKNFVKGDFYVDEVEKVEIIEQNNPEYVYDLSVNPTENFIGGFGGILLHNTESVALFEAMRIGALANVVAGTIHGESAYGVYDRVVHDLGVPPTSFKALDLITICNMLRSPDGLHRFRRVTELTEVRKKWKVDPLDEGGFVPLMQYSAKEDRLKPTDVLIDGESEVLNEIAKRVREWHGAWDLVWDNILLRAKIKQTQVEFAENLKRPEILEADWVVECNEAFHLISDEVRQEVGALDSKMIYEKWLEWFKEKLKRF